MKFHERVRLAFDFQSWKAGSRSCWVCWDEINYLAGSWLRSIQLTSVNAKSEALTNNWIKYLILIALLTQEDRYFSVSGFVFSSQSFYPRISCLTFFTMKIIYMWILVSDEKVVENTQIWKIMIFKMRVWSLWKTEASNNSAIRRSVHWLHGEIAVSTKSLAVQATPFTSYP